MTSYLTLITTELRRRWLSLLLLSLTGFLFAYMYIALFPSIKAQADQLSQLTQSMDGLLKSIGIEDLGFTTVEGFLSIEYFTIIWPILAFILVSSWAGGMIAGEIDTGTMGRLLSLPLGRQRIFWSKYLASCIGLLIFTTLSCLLTLPLAQLLDIQANSQHFINTFVMCSLFAWAFLSFGFMVSAMVSERGKVIMAVSGLGLLMYVATAVSGLKPSMQWLEKVSFFSYLDVQQVLVNGQWHWPSVFVFSLVIVGAAVLGAIAFQRRDISV